MLRQLCLSKSVILVAVVVFSLPCLCRAVPSSCRVVVAVIAGLDCQESGPL